jgi:hypothetical protein
MKKLQCPKCHKPVTSEQEFCPGCGQKLEFSAKERRSGRLREILGERSMVEIWIAAAVDFGLPALLALWMWVKGDGEVSYWTAYLISWALVSILLGGLIRFL